MRDWTERGAGGHCSTGRPEHLTGPANPVPPGGGPARYQTRYQARVERVDVCPNCTAPRSCCHCAADVAALRRFATRMAMIHQRTGTPVCGCGAHACYVRTRLDDIAHRPADPVRPDQ